jgi:hypothetical protein
MKGISTHNDDKNYQESNVVTGVDDAKLWVFVDG